MGKLAPTTSFATSDYRGLHAFCLIDAEGGRHWGRYTWEPEEGLEYLTDEQREAAARDYLQKEIRERLGSGIARFTLEFTLANEDDPLDDPTHEWEGEREVVELGELELTEVVEDPETPDKPLVFDPDAPHRRHRALGRPDPRRAAEGLLGLDRPPLRRLIRQS